MIILFYSFFALLGGFLAVLFLCVGVADGMTGDYRVLAGGLLYAFVYGGFAASQVRKIRATKKKYREDLAAIVDTLEVMPYDQAVRNARERYAFFAP